MKRSLLLLLIYITGAISVYSQDRDALEDSVIIGGISRSLVEMLLVNSDDQMTPDHKLMVQWAYAEFMKDVAKEHLVMFSDEELQSIADYYRTDIYRYTSSGVFLTEFADNLIKALQYELGLGKGFTYELPDPTYGADVRKFIDGVLVTVRLMVDNLLSDDSALLVKAKEAGMTQSQATQISGAVRRCIDRLGDIYLLSLIDYISEDSLLEMEKFCMSPLGKKYFIYSQKIQNAAELLVEDFFAQFQKMVEDENNSSRIESSIAHYVSVSRAFPDYYPVLYRPNAELKVGKGTYSGQTRAKVPHGIGELTDKKGVKYKGSFKDGKRHGLFEVVKPGQQPVLQFWIDDKYNKNIPVDDVAGQIPDVHLNNGEPVGYGYYYDHVGQMNYAGVFVDGELNGIGQVVSPDRSAQGNFVNGQLVEGKMVWKHTDWSINEFTGRFSNYLNVGARKLVSKDGGRQERHVGSFVNGAQDGEGSRKIVALHDVIDISGTYAYGKMYGKGQFKRVSKNDGNGIRSTEIYDGDFFADTFHGNGRMTVSLSDIPAGSWTFTRCNVKLPSVVAASMDIVMEGIFESGAFVSGRVSYSDGSWFEGAFTSSGLAQGRMLRKYSDGSWYEGECKDGKCDGYGVMRYLDGTMYEGMFKDGRPVNAGIAKPQDDEGMPEVDYSEERTFSYAEANLRKGQARLITPAGVKMILRVSSAVDVVCKGRFEKNIMVEGRATSSEGTWVEGRFEDGVLVQGRGRTTDKYGTIYEGDIRNGYPHGAGKCTYSDGTSFKGYFANGNRMSGTHYAADGSVIKVYD